MQAAYSKRIPTPRSPQTHRRAQTPENFPKAYAMQHTLPLQEELGAYLREPILVNSLGTALAS